ncbi:MAG TPA: SET domain-containing protein-lysine N-methyltransferase [Spirochaetota bacterium]|nr:SET domain-containing protein-lysine N-methyltransferase [Spirochaetota bacterium]
MSKRLYPDFIPPYANEPTSDKLQIVSTPEKGEGVIALVPFKAGECVFVFTGALLSEQTLFTLQLQPGFYIHDPIVMGKVLHSCSPNTSCDMATRTFTAVKDIAPGDFITMDYETTEDVLFRPFHCACGAPECRGLIRGKKFLSSQIHEPSQIMAAAL